MDDKEINVFQEEKEKVEEKEIFKDYPEDNSPSAVAMVSKKTAIISIVATILILMIIGGSFAGGYFLAKSRGIEGDMPLLVEAYENFKKYYYKDISFEEFQIIASKVMIDSIDDYSFMTETKTNPGSIRIGISSLATVYNEYIIVSIDKNSPAELTVAKTYCTNPTYMSKPDSNYAYVHYEDQVNVEESKVHLEVGDMLYAVGYPGTDPIVLEGLDSKYVKSLLGASDILYLYFYKSNGNGLYPDEGLYKFIIEKKYIIDEYARLYTPEEIADPTGQTAMIEYTGFTSRSVLDFYKCTKAFKEAGYKHLILDLRNNGGGGGDVLAFVAAALIKGADKEAKPIIYNIRNAGNGKMKSEYLYTQSSVEIVVDDEVTNINAVNLPAEIGEDFKMTILCGGGTASSSEALIGALMYYNQTEIVGSTTFGKGVGQITLPFANGKYILYITNAQYFIPTDENGDGVQEWTKSIHEVGFTPKEENITDDVYRPIRTDISIQRALTLLNN